VTAWMEAASASAPLDQGQSLFRPACKQVSFGGRDVCSHHLMRFSEPA
jgi:hypothetical protein